MRKSSRLLRMFGVILFLALVFTIIPHVSPSLAEAQDNQLQVKNMDLQIWPEYDDPRVLAILSGTIVNSSDNDFDGRVYFNVPKNIEVQMACELINGTSHSCQPYDLEDKGDYQVLSWKTTHPLKPGEEYPIWLEYYYNPINGSSDKTIDLTYTPSYKTLDLKLSVREPLKSSNFKIDPAPSSTGQDAEGFKNDYFNFQNIDSTKPVNLKISYTRSETKPSVEKQNPDSGQQADAAQLGTSAWKKPEVIVPVVLFIIVLIIFIFYSLNTSRNVSPRDRINRIQSKYGSDKPNTKSKKNSSAGKTAVSEKKRIRQMLLDGEISEETYRELMDEL